MTVARAVATAGIVASCLGCDASDRDPCDDCQPDEYCYQEVPCPECRPEFVECVRICQSDDECPSSHRCLFLPDGGPGDAGADASRTVDAGRPRADAGATDASSAPDSSTDAAGPRDASSAPDSSADAAAQPLDGGASDGGGSADAASDEDAGSAASPRPEPPLRRPTSGALSYCSPYCDPDLCGLREDCSDRFGRCYLVDCSERVDCLPGAGGEPQICDVSARACYPANGACLDGRCPSYSRLRSIAAVVCSAESRFCEVEASLPRIPEVRADEAVTVNAPSPGTTYRDQESVVFSWEPTGSPVIVLVLDRLPSGAGDLTDAAIWGASRRADDPPNVRWADGSAIDSGVWLMESRPPPMGELFLLVQSVRLGMLVGLSPPVPFAVGTEPQWKMPGVACSDEGELPGTCRHPALPMMCRRRRCELLCASHVECDAALPGSICSDVVDGVRTCVPR